ncbi:MAG: Glu/Leu/Phe/Val dehydrogenase, partial [Actinobacteria bacterium]
KIVLAGEPSTGLRAIVVIDNTAAGPAIGGVRMAKDITFEEVFRLARAMTLKNAAARLSHGGGKSGIIADPAMPADQKESLIRAFAGAIAHLVEYTPGPDMGVDERAMAQIHDEIGRAVGLPAALGGLPLDTLGATGFGVAVAAEETEPYTGISLHDARVVIQGFGAVGTHAARFLAAHGAMIVAVSDSRGATGDPNGLDLEKLLSWKAEGRTVGEFPGGTVMDPAALVGLDCDIWVPAARPDVFTAANAGDVQARVIVSGANIPATAEAEQILHDRGVLVVPDFIANAGGVICAAVEVGGGTAAQAFATIEERIRENTHAVLERCHQQGALPREAAEDLALSRLREAMTYRRRF